MASSELTGNKVTNITSLNGTGRRDMPLPEGFQSVHDILRIVSICCYISIFVLSVLGNSAIIGIVLKNKNMRTKANVMIVNMSVSDLIITILELPRLIDVQVSRSYHWKVPAIIGEVLCKVNPFLREVSCAVSAFSMVGIAIDRFYAIVIPLANKPSVLKLKVLIPIIWCASIASNALFLYSYKLKFQSHAGKFYLTCLNTLNNYQQKIFYTFRFTAFIAVPLLTLTVLYVIIASKMTSHNIPGANTETVAKIRRKQNRNIVKLAVAIIVSFTVCWLPFYTGILLYAFLWESKPPASKQLIIPVHILQAIFVILTYASLAINPYVCLIFSSNFRRSASRTLSELKTSARHPITRITTTNRSNAQALSVSNLEISLDNLNAASNRGMVEEDSQQPSEAKEIRTGSFNNRQESNRNPASKQPTKNTDSM